MSRLPDGADANEDPLEVSFANQAVDNLIKLAPFPERLALADQESKERFMELCMENDITLDLRILHKDIDYFFGNHELDFGFDDDDTNWEDVQTS